MNKNIRAAAAVLLCFVFLLASCSEKARFNNGKNEKNAEPDVTVSTLQETQNTETTREPVSSVPKENQPRDIINGFPLYIEFEADFTSDEKVEKVEFENASYYVHELTSYPYEPIIIAYGGEFFKIEMRTNPALSYNWESIFKVYGISSDNPVIIKWKPERGIGSYFRPILTLTDKSGENFVYAVNIDEDGELFIEKTEVSRRKWGNESFTDTFDTETVMVKFFQCEDLGSGYYKRENHKYVTQEITVENFGEEFIDYLFLHTGAMVDDIWFGTGNKIFVNLNDFEVNSTISKFNLGSSGSIAWREQLLLTVASIPKVEKIEILVDGERYMYGGHVVFYKDFLAEDYRTY